jgi:hypothetical protein
MQALIGCKELTLTIAAFGGERPAVPKYRRDKPGGSLAAACL